MRLSIKKKYIRFYKLKKIISCKKNSIICNHYLLEKQKQNFIIQLFKWFDKDSRFYKINYNLKENNKISNFDTINLSVKIQKAGLKALLLNLDYYLKDYKELRKKSYTLNFTFFFLNLGNNKYNEITVDISAKTLNTFNIFITINDYYIREFYSMIYNLNIQKLKKQDENDKMLENLDYIYTWYHFGKIISYHIYMPWYLTKEEYNSSKFYKSKFERQHRCIIKERKFTSIFPLKNVLGYIVVMDQKDIKEGKRDVYWKTIFKSQTFNKKDDFFKELKLLIRIINRRYNLNSMLVYFYIEFLK